MDFEKYAADPCRHGRRLLGTARAGDLSCVPLPRPAGSRRYGRDAPYGQRRLVRSAQHPLRSGRGRYLGSHAATVGHHRLHGHVRLVADEERRQSLLPLVLPALGRCLRILHHRRSLLDVHVLRSGADPDVPAHRRLGQRPQGVFGHEADADAHGRVGPAALRHPGHLLRCRGADDEPARDRRAAQHSPLATVHLVPDGLRRLRRAGRPLPVPHLEPRRSRIGTDRRVDAPRRRADEAGRLRLLPRGDVPDARSWRTN